MVGFLYPRGAKGAVSAAGCVASRQGVVFGRTGAERGREEGQGRDWGYLRRLGGVSRRALGRFGEGYVSWLGFLDGGGTLLQPRNRRREGGKAGCRLKRCCLS